MFCKNCGKQIADNVTNCPYCGASTANMKGTAQQPTMPYQQAYQQPYQQPYQQAYQQPVQQPVQQPYQQPYQQPVQAAPEKKGLGLGIAALLVGIFTFLMNLIGFVAIGLAVGAISMGAKSKYKTPIVLGVIAIIVSIIMIIINFVVFLPMM